MPFGLVTAWNKRRRSKSQDHSDPCMFFFSFSFSFDETNWGMVFTVSIMNTHFQGCINLWSTGSWMIKIHLQKDGMHHQFSRSRKWKRQHALSVMRNWWVKEDLAEFTEVLCGQERYVYGNHCNVYTPSN